MGKMEGKITHKTDTKNKQPHTKVPKNITISKKLKSPQKSTRKRKSKRNRNKEKETQQKKPLTNKQKTQKPSFPRKNKNIIYQKKTNITAFKNKKHNYTHKN
jgi:hypothetical protein